MQTEDIIRALAGKINSDTSIVCSLGRTAEEVFRFFPDQTLFLDSMGSVTATACGVALALGPAHNVIAFDTDGSHLMGMTVLPTLSDLAPKLSNLLVLVLDNGIYEAAGGLPSRPVDLNWALLGAAWGLNVVLAKTLRELEIGLSNVFREFLYVVVDVNNTRPMLEGLKTMDGVESKYRFVRHLERVTKRRILRPATKA